ncbi:TolC family protein [Maribacter polysaccharolyticus]|uniref:TolC family protein n=1 Tax=Maribacter polysaccharolyticus TaxID=3020831 RepID=UPI00237F3456|nr:TolC family protein [Maribacter polysaccharolyticus]MDE3741449.1 TolC family protein [Maribacter polysaccharolyticus]
MKFKLTAILLVLTVGWVSAQQKKWTLEECVAYALENNLSIAQYELNLEDVKIDGKDALGDLLPSLNGSSSVSSNTGFSINPTNNLPTNSTTFNYSGSLTAGVTLFDGLQSIRSLGRAKLAAISSQYQLDDLKDDISLNVANAYLQVLSNKEALKVSKAQYAVTEQDLKRTKELVESGVVAKGDLLEIEATAANQEQQIVNNEGLVLISKINLAQLLQITDYGNFDVADEAFEIPPSDILNNSAETIFAKALEFRNDIKLSKTNVELAEKDLQIAKGAYYPSLSGFFQYNNRYSDATEIPNTDGVYYTPGFKDQMWIFDGISYGASLSLPIFNGWSTRNSVSRYKINLEKTKLQFEQDKLDLETTVNQAYVDVTTFYKSYEAAEKTLEARRLAYEYAKERFNVGLMNSFDYSQAQARVDNAEAEVIRAKYAYIFRLKILEFYFGIPISLE